MAAKSFKQAGKLSGETTIELHTRDCVSLFDGIVPSSKTNTKILTLSMKAYNSRIGFVANHCKLDDPVAQEILVKTEKASNELLALCAEKRELVKNLMQPFENVIDTSSYSSSPVKKKCDEMNTYAMLAVRNLLIIDATILDLMKALHVALMTKVEVGKHRRDLTREYRAILLMAFQYQPKITREDFDAGNKEAIEKLKYYREKLYIKQSDSRGDDELMQHYANYSKAPQML